MNFNDINFSEINFITKVSKIFSNANRAKIIYLLANEGDKKLTVNDIAEKISAEPNNVSNHLVRMREIGILQAKQDGANMYYALKDQRYAKILKAISSLA